MYGLSQILHFVSGGISVSSTYHDGVAGMLRRCDGRSSTSIGSVSVTLLLLSSAICWVVAV